MNKQLGVFGLILGAVLAVGSVGCDPNGGGNNCANIAGTWDIDGACGSDLCVITQNDCNASLSCSSGSASYSGTVTNTGVTYSGTSGQGVATSCSGTISGGSMAGTCSPQGQATCTFSADRQ